MQEMQETQLQSLDWADPLEEEPTAVFLLEKFHGQRSLEGYSPWGRKESYTTERQSKGDSVSERMCMSIRRQAGGGENVSQTRYVCAAWEA